MNAFQLFDVFSQCQLQAILSIAQKIPRQPHALDNIYTNGFTDKDLIYVAMKKMVIDPINQHLTQPIKTLSVGMQLCARDPFVVHSDFQGKNDSGHGTAFLIPLYQNPVDDTHDMGKTMTIVFDQCWTESQSMQDYIDSDPPLPDHNAEPIWDQHLDNNPRPWAKYLSVKLMAPWVSGSVIAWDRRLLHASDNFVKKNIAEKSALVLFTQHD